MFFIGDGCNLHIAYEPITPDKNVYLKGRNPTPLEGDGAVRCTDSYLITKKCAQKIINGINKSEDRINLPADWWLNTVIRENKFIVYWAEPTLVTQGSKSGQSSSFRKQKSFLSTRIKKWTKFFLQRKNHF